MRLFPSCIFLSWWSCCLYGKQPDFSQWLSYTAVLQKIKLWNFLQFGDQQIRKSLELRENVWLEHLAKPAFFSALASIWIPNCDLTLPRERTKVQHLLGFYRLTFSCACIPPCWSPVQPCAQQLLSKLWKFIFVLSFVEIWILGSWSQQIRIKSDWGSQSICVVLPGHPVQLCGREWLSWRSENIYL